MSKRKCNPPPWGEPDCNQVAHAVMDETSERLDGSTLEPTPVEERRKMFDLLEQAAEEVGIPVVRRV